MAIRWTKAAIGAFGAIATCLLFTLRYFVFLTDRSNPLNSEAIEYITQPAEGVAPSDLLKAGVYTPDDFKNEAGVQPPFWDCYNHTCNSTAVWGPCYAPSGQVNWQKEIEYYEEHRLKYNHFPIVPPEMNDVSDLCRPSWLIIGAGKSATSSLYAYLTDHDRVLPASEKQIHYFKYYSNAPMKWYLGHFPTATSFLATGALMTGEASPGYLPYPDVAHMVKDRLPGVKIIAIGREPLDRAYSSYRYNYVNPMLEEMRRGKHHNIKGGQSLETYNQHLFSFEDMMKAELKVLRECFGMKGPGVVGAEKRWSNMAWARKEYSRRHEEGLPPLIDLDGFCYGEAVPRRQWTELLEEQPGKVIGTSNLHLKQSFIGRGLYALPLEWWYVNFVEDDIYFVCTEELQDLSGAPLDAVGQWLGLPPFNFSATVSKGAYNVGGHTGYEKETSWEEIIEESDFNATEVPIPLSDDFRKELDEFILPFNQRLFELTGRRCKW